MSNIDTKARVSTSRALQILNVFRDMDPDMPMGQAVSFLLIAGGETKEGGGITITELSERGEFALSSSSRYVKAMVPRTAGGNRGRRW